MPTSFRIKDSQLVEGPCIFKYVNVSSLFHSVKLALAEFANDDKEIEFKCQCSFLFEKIQNILILFGASEKHREMNSEFSRTIFSDQTSMIEMNGMEFRICFGNVSNISAGVMIKFKSDKNWYGSE